MKDQRDIDGVTSKEWAENQFEFEYCNNCHGDIEDHDYILVLGHWFARCKKEEEDDN
jgi:hypothetical protein